MDDAGCHIAQLVMSLKLLYLVTAARGTNLMPMVTKAGKARRFFLVLSSFAANVVAPTTSELEEMYSAAAQELDAGHYREALQKLRRDRCPPARDMAAAQNLRGVAWMRLAEYRKAEDGVAQGARRSTRISGKRVSIWRRCRS